MLHKQLEALFGAHTVNQAGQVDPSQVNALSVKQAVGALLLLKGQPEAQQDYVRSLSPDLGAALCRWLSDPAFWGEVAGITVH